ncbi:protein phosphatase 1 regulatory subunit 3C-like [Styela clava]
MKGISLASFDMVGDNSFSGVAHVENICDDKKVYARVTSNKWKSWADIPAKLVGNETKSDNVSSCRVESFQFNFKRTNSKAINLEFALFYRTSKEEIWDNNSGLNYVFNNIPATLPQTSELTLQSDAVNRYRKYNKSSLEDPSYVKEKFDIFLEILEESIRENMII